VKFTRAIAPQIDRDLIIFDQAMDSLTEFSCKAQATETQFFVGLTPGEIAAVLNISMQTVTKAWRRAKAGLSISQNEQPTQGPRRSDGCATMGND
jgi:hypothetical protein